VNKKEMLGKDSLFWPVYVIIVGAIILLVNLGVLNRGLTAFWPLIFILPGLLKLSAFGTPEKKK
jgi:hypothetical protein